MMHYYSGEVSCYEVMNRVFVAVFLIGVFLIVIPAVAQTRHINTLKTRYSLEASVTAGEVIYKKNCLVCHQADGSGIQHMNPPLINTPYILGDKKRLIKILLNGFKEDVEINGQYYSNAMPSHDFLKDQEIADVLTYVRNNFGNKAGGITALKVKQVRAGDKKG